MTDDQTRAKLATIRFFAKTKILWGACEGCDPGNEGSEIAGEVLAAAVALEAALGPQLTAEEAQTVLNAAWGEPHDPDLWDAAEAKLSLIANGEKPT